MLLIGVKGHAGMSPHRNFGRGWGKLRRGPIKPKTTLPHGEKKVAERPSKGRKKLSPQEKRRKKGLHIEKKVAERPLNGEKKTT